jgi:hypothetical protein
MAALQKKTAMGLHPWRIPVDSFDTAAEGRPAVS